MPSGSSDQQMVFSLIPFLTAIYHIYLSDRSITLVYFYLHIIPEAHRYKTIPCSAIHKNCIIYIYICVCYRPVLSIKSLPVPSTLYLSVPTVNIPVFTAYNHTFNHLLLFLDLSSLRIYLFLQYIIDVLCIYMVHTCFLETVSELYLSLH